MAKSTDKPADKPAGTATDSENTRLEHSEGGVTTRDDRTDLGVPMLPGDPSEPVGPEDALGRGPTRGDYRERIVGNPSEVLPIPDAKPGEARSRVEAQRPRADQIGDEKGKKGGVDTA